MRASNVFLGLTAGLLLGLGALPPGEARACGGGVVSEGVDANVSVGAQRVFVSVRKDGTTDIVTQLAVSGTSRFGVLIPLPSAPTLDETPIDTRELDALDAATQVHFFSREEWADDEGESSGCGSSADAGGQEKTFDGSNGAGEGVTASEFVDVGPVTAVVLTADDGAALTAWLQENGFAVATNDQSVIDAYVGEGRHFLAFKRADGAPTGETSVGIHFSLAGDQRGYPLRMARLGAGSEIAITTFVASEYGAAPTAPFAALTLDDLQAVEGETPEVIEASYKEAIRAAVRDRAGKAFVIEGVYGADEALARAPKLDALAEPGYRLTRLTTIMTASSLDTDVAFTAPAPEVVPTSHELGVAGPTSPQGTKQAFVLFGMLLPALAGLSRRRWR